MESRANDMIFPSIHNSLQLIGYSKGNNILIMWNAVQTFFQYLEPVEIKKKQLELEIKKTELGYALELKKVEAEVTRCRYNRRVMLDDRREAEFLSSGELPRKIRGDAQRSLQRHLPQ